MGISNPHRVLEMKTGVCHGYTTLFQAIAREIGLDVIRVDGNYRGIHDRRWTCDDSDCHTWNMVSLH